MSKKKKEDVTPMDLGLPDIQVDYPLEEFTGVARSVECYDNSGFRNFRILTLHIQDGLVQKIERSDPYANFEAISRLELASELAIMHLNNTWQDRKTLSK